MQVQPPLLEKETTMLFINTLKAPFITHMIGSTTKSFADIVMAGEMIENAIRGGKIEAKETTRRSALGKKIVRQESGPRQNADKIQFMPIPMTYKVLYNTLLEERIVSPYYLQPMQPPYPKWYDSNAQCDYHAGATGYSIENCTAFKRVVERLLKLRVVKLEDMPSAANPLPNHGDKGVNAIGEDLIRKTKGDILEVKTPLRIIWREMARRRLIKSSLEERSKEPRNYCEFHKVDGHEIQDCAEFRALVQSLIDNKEMEFYEEGSEGGNIHTTEGELTNQKVNYPRVIIFRPRNTEGGTQIAPKVIIQRPVSFPYKDNKVVPWNYSCNIMTLKVVIVASTSNEVQREGFYTRNGKRYDSVNIRTELAKGKDAPIEPDEGLDNLINVPMKEEEAKEFLKFLKHSEYSVVEQLHKQPARISVLALLLSSEVHREALVKVLNETYVTKDISVNKIDQLVSNISADNVISFSDDEIPPGGMGSTKALHITTRCKGYTLPSVLIDNGSALNVLPLSTLKRLPIDSSHIKTCQNIVRAFDGTERRVMGRIDIPLQIGPNIYEVDFLVMDIKPSYNCLLGRPWIHSAGAVPSSLHKKLKLVTDGRLVTINAEEDIIATVTNNAPYVETNEEAIECSFRSLEFFNATFISEGSKVPVPKISKTTRMGLQMIEKRDRFGLGFKPDVKQMRKDIERKQERRRARLNGEDVKWEPMIFLHISQTFVSGGKIHPERGSLNINDMSDDNTDPDVHFEQDMCLEESRNFKDGRECDLSPDLLRMVKQEEKQILPHEEEIENIILEEGKVVKIGTHIAKETRQDLIELLREFKYVFAWSYQDMPGLSTDIVVHRLPIREECKPVQQKLRRMRPDIVLKIKEEVQKQFDAGFLQVVKYLEWVANIVPVSKKNGKVRMCVDYRDLNKASPKNNFPLPHIDTLKNAGATYQRAMVTLFHDMMHKDIEVYVDDMIAKSRTEKEHIEVLRKLFLRLRKFQLKLNPAKCTFGSRSGKLLGFVKEVRGFLGRLNYIARFISQLTEKCDPIFRLLKKHNPGVWDDECQRAFDKVKMYLSNAPVLSPPNPDKPLILYFSVFNSSMGCVLGQHDETGRKEKVIYYLSKKFTDCEMRYS
ncbi:RNA-directed DNA polymerase (Reverse transcriptase), Ribonuclease H-like protein [Gossypium australe]|uniref:RNA-directed DNA polymerase (Reverse transcriptase), Ribonuclease H-like protein n=1 Tax=Gossypium australe TaxID=47621 RepID=A0A5B6U966_9ROSI|nr:RNA-directed DNA polymerase (Reverse transcriptase), Ribonuclease H-like protein [Gossypium australe]